MLNRLTQMSKMGFYAIFRKFRADFAKELVIAISGLVVLALYYYIFNDFLNHEVKAISKGMYQAFARFLAFIVLLTVAVKAARQIGTDLFAKRSIRAFSFAMGEATQTLKAFALLWSFIVIASYYGISFWLLSSFVKIDIRMPILMLLITGGVLYFSYAKKPKQQSLFLLLKNPSKNRQLTLLVWRLKQILTKNLGAQIALIIAALLTLPQAMFQASEYAALAHASIAYLSGSFFALALIRQTSFDLEHADFERNLGVSHREFMMTLLALGLLFALLGSTLNTVMALISPHAAANPLDALKLFAIAFVPPFLVPCLALQIDGRRSGIQMLAVVLISLFLDTAILATNLAIFLLPFVGYYGIQSQTDRYYRA